MVDPWSLYWQADRLDSADAIHSAADYDAIRSCWAELANLLGGSAAVLDLATGNGTVPAALLEADRTLQITGVDRADIDPLRYLASPGLLTGVDFRSGVDVCSLPFAANSFDAVTSQFGIEYAPMADALGEAGRVTRPGGYLQFLLHCDDSEVVQPSAARREEMALLLQDGGVLATLRAFVSGSCGEADLEAAGRAHRESGTRQTEGITGQIFQGVGLVIEAFRKGDRHGAAELCETMWLRLAADRDRLLALEAAALSEEGFGEAVSLAQQSGIETLCAEKLYASADGERFALGWLYRGRRA